MKLFYLVSLDVDDAQLVADNPPEDVRGAVADEIKMALEEKGARGALGIRSAVGVLPLAYNIGDYAERCQRVDDGGVPS